MQTLRLTHRLDLRLVGVLRWQKRGVSKIGEALPSGSGTNQNNFYLVVNVVVVVFTLKAVPVSTQYFLTSVLVQLTRTPSVVTG